MPDQEVTQIPRYLDQVGTYYYYIHIWNLSGDISSGVEPTLTPISSIPARAPSSPAASHTAEWTPSQGPVQEPGTIDPRGRSREILDSKVINDGAGCDEIWVTIEYLLDIC